MISCTDCGTTLIPHCSSGTCHWWHCPGKCEWVTYDLERGIRVSTSGAKVERLGAEPECDGEAATPDA